MGHSYNHGLVTSMKGAALEAIRITGLNGAPGASATVTIAEQCGAGLVSSVLHTATGTYTLQLSQPYPPKVVIVSPEMSNADGTTDILTAAYKSNSYNATTGQLVIVVMNDDDSGAPVLADGGATDELHVFMIFRRYTTVSGA